MNKTERFTDKEWEELASLLSDEKGGQQELLNRFMDNDIHDTVRQWKELKEMNNDNEINTDLAWNRLHTRINESSLNAAKDIRRIRSFRNAFVKVAAAVLILLSLGITTVYLYRADVFSKKITLATNIDQKNVQVSLPDGSKIFLNRNSELSYRSNFGKNKRLVRLSGEAFFEVSPDAAKPFVIEAGSASVKVVGTSFNVISNNNDCAVEVFVKSGKVVLSDNSGSQSMTLDPGYIGTMDSKTPGKTLNNNPNYLAWNTGLLVYNGQKLDVVFKDLKRVYNMDVVASDPEILENTWTSPIDNQPSETIIRLICTSFNLSYTKDGTIYHLTKK